MSRAAVAYLFRHFRPAAAQVSTVEPLATPATAWAEIAMHAKSFVLRERRARPFTSAKTDDGLRSERAVFVDYFPPMPLSFHNVPAESDAYDRTMTRPEAYDQRFASVGGYVGERPLAVEVWQSPFWRQINLAIDVLRAAEIGADGFMVDVLRLDPDPAWSVVTTLYEVAAHIAPGFRIVPEIDHAAIPDCTVEQIVQALTALYRHPSAYRTIDGRMLVAAFWPERLPTGLWQNVVSAMMTANRPIAFLPVFLNTAAAHDFIPFSYGVSTWGERDPVAIRASASRTRLLSIARAPQVWMQAVAPQDVRPKVGAFWEADGSHAFREAWRRAIEENAALVHLITWNDYSESTEIEPSTGIHYVFYDLSAYFIEYFKMHRPPEIVADAVYFLYRRTLINPAHVKSGDPFVLRGETPLRNTVECAAFLTAPADINIEIGGVSHRKQVDRGLQVLSIDAQPGTPVFQIIRQGKVIISQKGEWPIQAHALIPRPLYVGGSSEYRAAR